MNPLTIVAAWSGALLITSLIPIHANAQMCEPAPVLREADVNQSLPYSTLVAGKDTTVKLHLTTNECAGTVKVTGGELTVVAPSGISKVNLFQIPSGNVATCCSPQPNSDGDPRFFLNGGVVTAPAPEPFSITLTAQILYTVSTAGGTRSVTFSAEADGDPLVRQFVNVSPIRTLFAPMGRTADGRAAWWPDAARAELQKAALSASRFDPVRRGVCSPIQPVNLAAASCGYQYSIYDGLVDVSEFVQVEKGTPTFRGTLVGFSSIRKKLADVLQAYNVANPDRAADLVVGVVIEGKSAAPPAAQGVASVGGRESWIRLVTDVAGGILGQEQAHNFGLKAGSSIHADALRTQFDLGTERAHDPVTTLFIPDDRSLLQADPLSSSNAPWNNATVGLEQQDWLCQLAALAPGAGLQPCGVRALATPAGAGGEVLSIAGNTDLTSGGSEFRTVVSDSASCLTEAAATPLSVVYLDQNGDLLAQPIPLPASNRQTHPDEATGTWMVDCTVEWDDRAHTIQIRSGGTVLWTVDASTVGPANVEVRVRPARWSHRNESNDPGTSDVPDLDPAVSPSGTRPALLAWVKDNDCEGPGSGALVVKRLSDGQIAERCLSPMPTDPAISPSDREIAYARAGNIEIVKFDPDTPQFVGPAATAFFCAPAGAACAEGEGAEPLRGPASDPAWDAAGNRLAFSVRQLDGGELASIRPADAIAGIIPPRRLTLTPGIDERAPSWSQTSGENDLLVFERCENPCNDGPSPLFTLVDAGATVPTPQSLGTSGNDPSWGEGFIAARDESSRIVLIYPPDAGHPDSRTFVTGGGSGFPADSFDPSLHRNFGPVAFESGNEVWTANATGQENEISVRAEDDKPLGPSGKKLVYAHVYNRCGVTQEAKPLAVGLEPSSIDGNRVFFHTTVDLFGTCGGGTVKAIVSDGENTGTNSAEPSLGSGVKAQTPAISWPFAGSELLNTDALTLNGSVLDPELGAEASGSPESPLQLEWFVDGRSVGVGPRVTIQPGGSAHAFGTHTVELRATDPGAGGSSAAGADLLSAASAGCSPPACTSTTVTYSINAKGEATFDPHTWQVPSNGVVTYSVTASGIDLTKITAAELVKVDGSDINDASRWGANIANGRWQATSRPKVDGNTLVIKFDRNACTPLTRGGTCLGPNAFFQRNDLVRGQYVRLTVEGSGGGFGFRLFDPDSPILQPA